MFKISGLNQLERQLADAQKAIAALDGELGSVSFDPADPASIEAAIQQANRLVDERIGGYVSNPIVGQLAQGMKERFREAVLDKAAAARLTDRADE